MVQAVMVIQTFQGLADQFVRAGRFAKAVQIEITHLKQDEPQDQGGKGKGHVGSLRIFEGIEHTDCKYNQTADRGDLPNAIVPFD
jgi:hypothetical protein